ncbi:DUF4416 family protein [candidate division CSSED10-310 bacterium]|uniref:DUF4416 family protein n=1 Tax=candidate division CSSED10-310 bacterium TaxID=2855610 RepID=A0ABV6YW30_UNCC1
MTWSEPLARPIAALLCHRDQDSAIVEKKLEQLCGSILAKSDPFPFNHSHYYTSEMGTPLSKYYLVFGACISPGAIIRIKHETSLLEGEYLVTREGRTGRLVNIDPGYFTHAQLILATHKNYSHRIFLGQGVYAELTYQIQGRQWIPLPWTYPDYRTSQTISFFSEHRAAFVKETKGLRQPASARVPMWKILRPD